MLHGGAFFVSFARCLKRELRCKNAQCSGIGCRARRIGFLVLTFRPAPVAKQQARAVSGALFVLYTRLLGQPRKQVFWVGQVRYQL